MNTTRKFLYKFKVPDPRNFSIKLNEDKLLLETNKGTTTITASKLNPTFKISYLAPILDQGNLGSCVCNSASLIISTQTKNRVSISRILLYALCRIYDNSSLDQDSGTTVLTCCKIIKNNGACLESVYPYTINNFSLLPSLNVFKSCNLFKNFTYYSINQDLNTLKQCLVTYNMPITFGIYVYDSFLSIQVAKTGIVPMPNTKTETLQGGHCVTMVGYDDNKSWFICANSWGTSWGSNGLFYLPYNYVLDPNLAGDFFRYTFIY